MASRWTALTARHSTVAAVLAVVTVFGAAALGLAAWPDEAPLAESTREDATPHPQLVAPLRVRCETCGVIEAIRLSEATPDAPRYWEFAVRLPDGSLRLSSDPQPGRWQVGDRMQLLGGGPTWSTPSLARDR